MRRYVVHDQNIESDWALPDGVDETRSEGPFDLCFRRGTLDLREASTDDTGSYHFAPEFHEFSWPELGAIRISKSGIVIVDERPGAPAGLVEHVLLGPVLADWLLWQGKLPLHASAVAIENQVVAFVGRSGAGKSTLAAALVKRGAVPFADDLLAVSPETGEVSFGGSRLKLNPDSLRCMGWFEESHPRVYETVDKRSLSRGAAPKASGPRDVRQLTAIYRLVDAEHDQPTFESVPRLGAALLCMKETFRVEVEQHALGAEQLLSRAAQVAEKVPVFLLRRQRDFSAMETLCEAVVSHVRALGSSTREE